MHKPNKAEKNAFEAVRQDLNAYNRFVIERPELEHRLQKHVEVYAELYGSTQDSKTAIRQELELAISLCIEDDLALSPRTSRSLLKSFAPELFCNGKTDE